MHIQEKNFRFFSWLFLVGCFFPSFSYAATLSLTPSSGNFTIGQTFTEKVLVNSTDQSINAVSASISYPKDLVSLISVSKNNSIIKIWADEPSFSNDTGTLSFEGIILNPGFQGNSGIVLTLTFKVKSVGVDSVSFSSASVLANDGNGTNVLTGTTPSKLSIVTSEVNLPKTDSLPVINSTNNSAITSKTHPDQKAWYNNNNPEFSWTVPKGTTEVLASLDTQIRSTPTKTYILSSTTKAYTKIDDGVWYFNLQFRNGSGVISTSHYKIQIDTVAPEPMHIVFPHSNESLDPRPIITFNTFDKLSGISHYQIKIKEQDYFKVDKEVDSNPFTLPPQDLGKGAVLVQAFDNAGNSTIAMADFIVDALNPPKFTDVPDIVSSGDILRMQGETYPNVTVYISLKDESKNTVTETTQSVVSGHFSLVWPKRLPDGLYTITAYVVDSRNAKSIPSPEITIKVNGGSFMKFGWLTVNYLSLTLFIMMLFALVISGAFYLWHKVLSIRHKFEISVHKTESKLHKVFDLLREDMESHLKSLEHAKTKRALTKEEEKIIESLKKNLSEAESVISRDIGDIIK